MMMVMVMVMLLLRNQQCNDNDTREKTPLALYPKLFRQALHCPTSTGPSWILAGLVAAGLYNLLWAPGVGKIPKLRRSIRPKRVSAMRNSLKLDNLLQVALAPKSQRCPPE